MKNLETNTLTTVLAVRRPASAILLGIGLLATVLAAPAAETSGGVPPACPSASSNTSTPLPKPDLEARWGIQVTTIRLSANGNLIDFRYRVMDPEKAAVLGSAKIKPVLIDQENGAQLHVPSMPKVGQLRSTQRLVAGKIYTALFANPGGMVKKGHKVTVVFGDFRAENLTVGE